MNRKPEKHETSIPDDAVDSQDDSAPKPLLMEIAWETCNQVGGIYTVIRSKVPAMMKKWEDRYCLVGPYNERSAPVEFDQTPYDGPFGEAVEQMVNDGIEARYGRWLVTGRPPVVLLNHKSVFDRLHEIKYRLWNDHGISTPADDALINDVVAFGELVRIYLQILAHRESSKRTVIGHIHEWMAGTAIPQLRAEQWPGTLVFTTHATMLGRYLAMNDEAFYSNLDKYDADAEAKNYNVESQCRIESAAAHGAHVFTTVSDVTADECEHLIKRKPDVILPNGLNIQRFERLHQLQNLHSQFKTKINEFTMGHFFPSYTFDLDKTLYFYTSGRYEYRNKGMDMTIEALARLNHMLKVSGSDMTVVAFIVTKRPVKAINVHALRTRAMLDEFRDVTDAIKDSIGNGLFDAAARGEIPDLNSLVDDYWRLRLRRTIHEWKSGMPPSIVTHDLEDDQGDEVLNQLRDSYLWNQQHDRVKIVYHPDFINTTNPLWGLDYDQFVRGCNMGIFPSYYEPWGYTPLESIALGVPAISSDLAGFGAYVQKVLRDDNKKGLYVIQRRYRSFDNATDQLANVMFGYCQMSRRERILMRAGVENFATHFDWHNLGTCYEEAHQMAHDRVS